MSLDTQKAYFQLVVGHATLVVELSGAATKCAGPVFPMRHVEYSPSTSRRVGSSYFPQGVSYQALGTIKPTLGLAHDKSLAVLSRTEPLMAWRAAACVVARSAIFEFQYFKSVFSAWCARCRDIMCTTARDPRHGHGDNTCTLAARQVLTIPISSCGQSLMLCDTASRGQSGDGPPEMCQDRRGSGAISIQYLVLDFTSARPRHIRCLGGRCSTAGGYNTHTATVPRLPAPDTPPESTSPRLTGGADPAVHLITSCPAMSASRSAVSSGL